MADSITTIRPNASVLGSGWTLGGGAASAHAATSDESDATFIRAVDILPDTTTLDFQSVVYNMDAVQVRSVRPRVRCVRGFDDVSLTITLRTGTTVLGTSRVTVDSVISTLSGLAVATSLTQAEIDALNVQLRPDWDDTLAGQYEINVHEVYLDVGTNSRPTVVLTMSSVANSSRLRADWTFTDSEQDLQERYELKVFSGSTAVNPDTETTRLLWQSGQVFSSDPVGFSDPVPNNSTISYLRAADVGSGGRWSLWDDFAFLQNVAAAPATPTISVTDEPTLGRVKLDLNSGGGTNPTESFRVQRSENGGPWLDVLEVAYAGSPVVAYDFEALRGVTVTWRAYAERKIGGETLISGVAPATTATATLSTYRLGTAGGTNHRVVDVFPGWAPSEKVRAGVFYPRPAPGQEKPRAKVARGAVYGIESPLPIRTLDKGTFDAVRAMLTSGQTLVLQDVFGQRWYLEVVGDIGRALLRAQPAPGETYPVRHAHEITTTVVEVAIP